MAPKRYRGESSKSSKTYDKRRFISEEIANYYDEIIAPKKLIPERGLDPSPLDGQLWQMIITKHWGIFTSQPDPAMVSIVKEFYANAKDIEHNEVRVRGKTVSFSAATINEYYDLPDMTDDDDYTTMLNAPINYENLIHTLCQPDATWKLTDGVPKNFSYSKLSRYGKAWYYFICAKLMPTTHVTEVHKERAVLLFCIVKEKRINIGNVINSSIKYAIQGGSSRGLPHPSLICKLCEQAGVQWQENEPTQPPMVVIDDKIIRNFKQWDGAPPEPKGAGFILEPQSSDDMSNVPPAPEPHEAEQSTYALVNTLVDEVRQLRRESSQVRRESRRQTRRMDHMTRTMNTMLQYNVDYTSTLSSMLARSTFNMGDTPLRFPDPPVIEALPPDSPEDEAED